VDPISDMLTSIRNGLAVKKQEAVLPYSNYKHNLAKFLVSKGLLAKAEVMEDGKFKQLKLKLKYDDSGGAIINGIKRYSKPGQRIYARSGRIPKVRYGIGVTVVSTSRGLMTDQEARRANVGGEIICQIW